LLKASRGSEQYHATKSSIANRYDRFDSRRSKGVQVGRACWSVRQIAFGNGDIPSPQNGAAFRFRSEDTHAPLCGSTRAADLGNGYASRQVVDVSLSESLDYFIGEARRVLKVERCDGDEVTSEQLGVLSLPGVDGGNCPS
jgi:hypothetical protein